MEPPLPAAAAVAAIESALDRLELTVDQENAALEVHQSADLEDLNRRKSCSLLEITRLTRALPAGAGRGLGGRLGRLRDKLNHNHTLLRRHLAAVREIADLMVGAIGEAESDGTYGMSPRRRETAS
jgi:flagellar biosynthesis/type III secretory pathway chaperone